MNAVVRAYKEADLSVMIDIWNQVVEDGVDISAMRAMPSTERQEGCISEKSWCQTV